MYVYILGLLTTCLKDFLVTSHCLHSVFFFFFGSKPDLPDSGTPLYCNQTLAEYQPQETHRPLTVGSAVAIRSGDRQPSMGLLARSLRSIVRNDAMRDDPDAIYNGRTIALVCCACFGGMLFGWDSGTIGGVLAMDQTSEKFGYKNRSKTDKSNLDQNIVSTLQAGCFAACLVTSWFADRFGRRTTLVGAGFLTTIGVVFQAASGVNGTLAVMYVGRFIGGLGAGCASTVTPLYVSECCPRAIRGGLTGKYGLRPIL